MTSKDFKYGIFIQNDLMPDLNKSQNQRTALLGQIVKIEGILADNIVSVRFLKDGESWESSTFCCNQKNLIPVNEKLWGFLAAVGSPQERVKLAKNREKCGKLLNLTKDSQVGFEGSNDVYLGQIKYMGAVRGMGKCFGIKLNEKKKYNKCDGSYAGSQYFSCLPGYGIFTTIERVVPLSSPKQKEPFLKRSEIKSDLDVQLEKNLNSLVTEMENNENKGKNYEEIVTKYGEYPRKSLTTNNNNNKISVRNSLSLQNIHDSVDSPVNTNNDFDQNTILQPDKTYLLNDKQKRKSEMDLIEIIGNCPFVDECGKNGDCNFTGSLKRNNLDKNENYQNQNYQKNGHTTTTKVKNTNSLLNFFDSTTNTLTRKQNASRSQFYVNNSDEKINEKVDQQQQQHIQQQQHQQPSTSNNKPKFHPPPAGSTNDLTIGSLVEVSNDVSKTPLYGVVRWIGVDCKTNFILVGVELEEEHLHLPLTLTNGSHNGEQYFKCGVNRGLFVPLEQCHKDSRFQDGVPTPVHQAAANVFDNFDCPTIQGAVAPLCMPTEEDVAAVCGKARGIQGHHNSCYLDVTLFSMFTYTAVFDSLLFRPKGPHDIDDYEEVQRVLREEIVNPLRKNLFVSANHVMNLRRLLDRLSSVQGLTSEEKDPEEFLNSLLAQILKAEPFLKLNSGQESFYYQLFVEKDAALELPTVQQLFEQSFLTSNIKLKEVPSCLIVQMPRFGKNYKMYPRILPSQLLDVTDVIEGSPRQCIVCGKLARWGCRECFDDCSNAGLESTAFCAECLKTAHKHEKRGRHNPAVLDVPHDFSIMEDHCQPPRLFMELFAVICIETSHYVAFVKCGVGHEAPWCFFDSMADRKGEKNGYNIPEMVACPDISRWLSDENICRQLSDDFPSDRHLPEHARRLLCDAYICMYQSSDVMMYR